MDPLTDNTAAAARIAAADQLGAGMRDVAAVLGAYRRELMIQGFSRDEALELCSTYQVQLLGAVAPSGPPQ